MYLLDTNILSETRKIRTGKANRGVIDWLADTPEHLLYVNAVVLMEVERGILAKERKDPQQGEVLRQWFEHVVKPTFVERTFVVDENTARICAKLHILTTHPKTMRGLLPLLFNIIWCWSRVILMILPAQA